MTRISTQQLFASPPPAIDSTAYATLQQGGLILLPTANLWQVVAQAERYAAVNRMLQLCPVTEANRPELVFADREALLSWFPRLHPKLDTLLSYHGRALTILTPAIPRVADALVDKRGEVAIRVALDASCRQLCHQLGGPVAATLAVGVGQADLPTRFGKVRSDVLRSIDHTVRRRQREELATKPAVRIRLHRGDVQFV